jgi:hypothetical protein
MVFEYKMCIDFLYSFCLKRFFILRRTKQDIITNLYQSSYKNRYSFPIELDLNFSRQVFEKHSNDLSSGSSWDVLCGQSEGRTEKET